MRERNQQLIEQEMLKKEKEEEDRLWALQQEKMRRMQVLHDKETKKKTREVAEGVRATQEQQQVEHF